MPTPKKIYLSSPTMNGSEIGYINEAIETNWVAPLGHNVDMFEKELAEHVGIAHSTALVSGTAALHLAVKLCGVKRGDLVFTSALTFSASANPIVYENGTPVFIDSETDTWCMSPEALEAAFKKFGAPKAVIVVNLYGVPAKLDRIREICDAYKTPLIEDAAESLGSTYHGRYTGTFGHLSAYSFNGNKIITTSGGGMLVSDDESAITKAHFWATQSRDPARYYQHSEIGYNYRMSNIVAGIGRGQLRSLEEFADRKRRIRATYAQAFSDIGGIELTPLPPDSNPNCWMTVMLLDSSHRCTPDDIIDALSAENIESRPFWKPMQLQPVFAGDPYITAGGESVSERLFARGVCLPSDIKNTDEDMDRITSIIRRVLLR